MTGLPASYYRATATAYGGFPPLSGHHARRVVVIGAGYAGLNTALGLAERGLTDVAVLEAEGVGFGASGRNGGFVFAGYSLGESALVRQLGPAVPVSSVPFCFRSERTGLKHLKGDAAAESNGQKRSAKIDVERVK